MLGGLAGIVDVFADLAQARFAVALEQPGQLRQQVDLGAEMAQVLVADGENISGELFHWGGTAEWKESSGLGLVPTEKLGNLTEDQVCFVKTDTDAFGRD